jgi:hypothetical protein
LKRAESGFEVFLTFDQNIAHQQPIAKFKIAYLEVQVRVQGKEDLAGVAAKIQAAILNADKGTITVIE